MRIGDLVRSLADDSLIGVLVGFWQDGVLILWDHGEVCFSPDEELEVINENE